MLPLALRLHAEHAQTFLHAAVQIKLLTGELDLAVLHAAHLQNIVDQPQEITAGGVDLVQAVGHPLPLIQVLPGEFAGAQDPIEGGAHIVGHVPEEGLLGLLILPRKLEGLLQQPVLPQLALLFLLHFPEGENHLSRGQGRVEENPHTDPAVFPAEAAEKLAAEVPNLLVNQLPDVPAGEALGKVPEGLRLNDLAGGAEQFVIGAHGGDAIPHIGGAFDHLISLPLVVHPYRA